MYNGAKLIESETIRLLNFRDPRIRMFTVKRVPSEIKLF